MTEEHALMNHIRLALSHKCILFRVNVGSGRTYDGRHFDTGVPAGFSDLFGVRTADGKAVFIEVKTRSGRVSGKQQDFLTAMKKSGAIAGVCRSVEDALELIK